MYVIDLNGNQYACQATVTNDYELNGNQALSATFLPSKVNRAFIDDIAEMWEITDFDDVSHKIVYAKKRGEGDLLSVEIKAVPLFFDDFDSQRIEPRIDRHMTAFNFFYTVFNEPDYNGNTSGYSFTLNDSFDSLSWEGLGEGETRLEMFKRGLNRYGAEFRIVGKTVYIHRQVGRDTQFQYRHRLNASNIVQENDATAFYTYAKGYGSYEDGEDAGWETAKLVREYTSPLAKIPGIGLRQAPPVMDGRVTHASVLEASLKALVDESLKISVTADIHDLRRQGYALAQPELGDRVFIIDERIGLNEEVRVVDISITRNWRGEVLDVKLTFGSDGLTKRHQSSLSTAMKNITELIEGRRKLHPGVYDVAITQAAKDLQNARTELQFPETGGILAVEKGNPNYLTLFNSAGLGVSDDGGATFKSAITGRGVVAETIVGQSIIGVNLSSADERGYFHVSGSNAEFYDTESRRRVAISPNGLYGYNAGGDVRFQADASLVTSAAFGTSNDNTYLVANNETRSVKYSSIPGDGNVDSYSYLPHRASIYRFPRVPNGYFTLLDGGEFRFTGEDISSGGRVYQPIRVGKVFSNTIEVNGGDIIYLRSANRVRSMLKGNSQTYAAFEGSDFIQSSSRKLKENIKKFNENATEIICGLNIVEFDYIDGDKGRIGVIAEESEVIGDGNSVSLGDATFLNSKAIQELAERLEVVEGEL